MRALWIDENHDADSSRMAANDITQPIYSVRDPRVTLSYLGTKKEQGYAPGLYLCAQGEGWPSGLSGKDWADWAYSEVQRIAPGTAGAYPKIHLNTEVDDAQWLVEMLTRWRSHSPRRETYLLIEGRKAGIFSPAQVTAINNTTVFMCPEFFTGDMTAHPEGFVTLPMLRAGFAPKRLYGCYDAAHLPFDWQGVAFIQGRLP